MGSPEPASTPWLEIILTATLLVLIITALPLPPILDPLGGVLRSQQNHAAAVHLKQAAHLGLFDDTQPWFALSRNRAGTARFLLLLIASFGMLMLSASLPRRWRSAHLYALVLIGAGVAVAGHISQWWIPQGDRLWWMIPIAHVLPGPVGCFVNRNHFGGFVAMLIPVVLVLATSLFRQRQRLAGAGLLGLLAAMIGVLVMSLSRGAWLACAAGCAAVVVPPLMRRGYRSWLGVIAALVLLAGLVAAVGALSPAARTRLASLRHPLAAPSVQNRLMEWRESLRVWHRYPVLGPGANALRMVYPQTRQSATGRWLVFSENEYVQLVAEGGLVGLALAGGLVWALRRRGLDGDRDSVPDSARQACVGAMSAAAVHCLLDFPLHLPLYATVLASLVGLAIPVSSVSRLRWVALTPALLGALAAAVLAWVPASHLRLRDAEEHLMRASPEELRAALVSAPTSWHAWYYLGRRVCQEGVTRRNLPLCYFGEDLMTEATRLDPQNYRLWYLVGRTRMVLREYDRADAAFARAQALRPWMTPPPMPRRR